MEKKEEFLTKLSAIENRYDILEDPECPHRRKYNNNFKQELKQLADEYPEEWADYQETESMAYDYDPENDFDDYNPDDDNSDDD